MSNTILTIDMITREALRILHQELRVIPKVRRDYDDRFAVSGAKIGDSLRIRKPAKYLSTAGRTLVVQNSTEQFVTLPVASQRHVGMAFSSAEMALDIDSYSKQFIKPAMAQLAADIEAEFTTYFKNNTYWTVGTATTNVNGLLPLLFAKQYLDDQLCPQSPRVAVLSTLASATLVGGTLSTLFNAQKQIADQYTSGSMGKAADFDFYTSSIMPRHTNGTGSATASTVDVAGQTGSTLNVDDIGNALTVTAGSVFTIANVNACHPETKADLGYLQQFVVTSTVTSAATGEAALSIQPPIVTSGPFQNVVAGPADGALLTYVGAAGATYQNSFFFHEDSFAFATADLDLPPNVEASRKNQDGLSLRVLRDYDVVNDQSIMRVDILYGYTYMYNQLAARVIGSNTYVAP